MAGTAYQTTVGLDPRFLSAPVVCVIALGSAFSGLLLCWKPIVVPVVIEVVIATLFLFKPAAALKLTLFSAGLPLSLFYEEVGYSGGSAKPLLSEWGGTTPDGLRLILSSLFLSVVLCKLAHTRGLLLRFWPYVALLLFLACTLSYSTAPIDGMRLLLKMAFPFLSFLALAQLMRSAQDADAYSRYWIAGGVLASFCAPVLILFTGSRFLYPAGSFRYSPGFTSASSYSFYMLALFLFCYSQWRKRHSTGFALLSGLFGIQTVIPITRIAWVALLVGVAGFEWLHVKGAKKCAAAVAAVVVPVLVFYFLISHSPALQERVFQSKQIDSDFSMVELVQNVGLTGRGAVWLAAVGDYQQHSRLLGQGIGSSDNYIMGLFGTVAHNEYLRILYDGGGLGLSLFLLANLYLLYRLARLRGSADAAVREYSAVGIALMLAYFVVALTDNPLDYYLLFTQYVFFVLGICFALSRYPSTSAHATQPT